MTYTHPDQMARTKDREHDGVMFPKGVHQMVAYVFAMEGVPAYERSIHARMIDMQDSGEIEYFSLEGINMSGHSALDRRGECAKLRQQIEETISGDKLHSIRARFGLDTLVTTYESVVGLIPTIHEHLSSGRRRAQRSMQYIGDLIWHTTCSPKQKEICTVCAIADAYHVRHQTVSKDIAETYKVLSRFQSRAMSDIEKKFAHTGIIPEKSLAERGERG